MPPDILQTLPPETLAALLAQFNQQGAGRWEWLDSGPQWIDTPARAGGYEVTARPGAGSAGMYAGGPQNMPTWDESTIRQWHPGNWLDSYDPQGQFMGREFRPQENRLMQAVATAAAMYGAQGLLSGAEGAGAGAGGAPMSATEAAFLEANMGAGAPVGGMSAAEAAAALGASGGGAATGGAGGATGMSAVSPVLRTIGTLLGGAAGAAESGDREGPSSSTTQQREPWAPAQPWLKGLLQGGQELQEYYQQNPLNSIQQQGAQQRLGLLNALNTDVLPGLLSGLGSMSTGYQRPGGPAPRANAFNFNPQGLLAGMQTPVDFVNPYRRG